MKIPPASASERVLGQADRCRDRARYARGDPVGDVLGREERMFSMTDSMFGIDTQKQKRPFRTDTGELRYGKRERTHRRSFPPPSSPQCTRSLPQLDEKNRWCSRKANHRDSLLRTDCLFLRSLESLCPGISENMGAVPIRNERFSLASFVSFRHVFIVLKFQQLTQTFRSLLEYCGA